MPRSSRTSNLASFALATTFLWASIHHLYVASFGFSLKSISLKDVELRPASDDLESILNRHLDEIIYFFQSTDHDLVIIEDLDRFDNAEIFVTLREINSLVNENAGVKRRVRFLYALRDDMFANTDRTKFFEFIIPVIPIINTSNSIDMVLQQGERLDLDERLDRQFLREVSRHLDDLRLIQNIFNEYAEEQLADYLDRDEVRATILQEPIPDDDGAARLRRFLLNAGSLSEEAYRDYVAALPRPFKAFPEGIGPDKSQILIDEQTVVFAKDTFEALAGDRDRQVSFLASNIETYLAGKTGISIDDDFREELVKADIDDAHRHALIGSMDLASLPDAPGRAAVIAPILGRVDRPLPELSADQARLLIENAGPVRSNISLLNKAAYLLPDEMVRDILSSLPAPYSRIRKGYFTPYLDATAENLELVTWLDDKNIISSWSRSILTGEIRVNLKRR